MPHADNKHKSHPFLMTSRFNGRDSQLASAYSTISSKKKRPLECVKCMAERSGICLVKGIRVPESNICDVKEKAFSVWKSGVERG
jgi:hypothetical protein